VLVVVVVVVLVVVAMVLVSVTLNLLRMQQQIQLLQRRQEYSNWDSFLELVSLTRARPGELQAKTFKVALTSKLYQPVVEETLLKS
jgi:type II secretory pathway pseudopilin PulG